MGFWCCVVAPKTALLFIPLLIYIWNRFLQPIWSNYWNGEEKIKMENQNQNENLNENSSVPKENGCDDELDSNLTNKSDREKID